MVIKGSAAEKLRQLGRATLVVPPPLRLFGVGGTEIVSMAFSRYAYLLGSLQ